MSTENTAVKIGVSIALQKEGATVFWSARLFSAGQETFLDGQLDGDENAAATSAMSVVAKSLNQPSILIMDSEAASEDINEAIKGCAGVHKIAWIKASGLPESSRKSVLHANQTTADRVALRVKALQDQTEKDAATKSPTGEPEIEMGYGKATGKEMFRVRGFEMPWCGSPEDALSVYGRLKHAYETGYYHCAAKPRPSGR